MKLFIKNREENEIALVRAITWKDLSDGEEQRPFNAPQT